MLIGMGIGGIGIAASPGGAQAFNPLVLNPLVWLEGDTNVTNDGSGNCSAWGDLSGNSRNAAQSTILDRPVIVSAGQNGLNILRFDGVTDFLSIPLFTGPFAYPVTWYAALKISTLITDYNPILDTYQGIGGNLQAGYAFYIKNTYKSALYAKAVSGQVSADGTGATTYVANNKYTLAWVVGDSATNPATSYTNNVQDAQITGSYTLSTLTFAEPVLIGKGFNTTRRMPMDLYHVSCFVGAHDTTTRGKMQTYIQGKWGI